ncbi:MAG: acyl-CoA thioesterase [Muribaculaceae bacterium]
MDKEKYIFSLELEVRDYEIDSEGIVNNANYQHYLEHTRHKFCEWAGLSFKDMQRCGMYPVVNRIEIDYKTPLKSNDVMVSCLNVKKEGVRFIFLQDIYNKLTQELAVSAVVSCVCIENGKLSRGEVLAKAFEKYL